MFFFLPLGPALCKLGLVRSAVLPEVLTPVLRPCFNLPMFYFCWLFSSLSFQFSSVTQLCPTPCNPMNNSTSGLPVHHQLPEFTKTHVHRVRDAIQPLILGRPLLLLPPIPPSIRVFFSESTLHMTWPKYSSFSFSISPSNEHPG